MHRETIAFARAEALMRALPLNNLLRNVSPLIWPRRYSTGGIRLNRIIAQLCNVDTTVDAEERTPETVINAP